MSSETLSLIQKEVHAMREYFTKQEERIQALLTEALTEFPSSSQINESESEKLKELQDALGKSKAAARAADGKIKLLQYQLAKSKSNNGTQEKSTCASASAVPDAPIAKKVSFEDETIQAASQDWLKHWLRMKPVCRDIAVSLQKAMNSEEDATAGKEEIESNLSVHEASLIKTEEDDHIINIDLEISRCSEMGNMLDELGILSESFVTSAAPLAESVDETEEKEVSRVSNVCDRTVSGEITVASVQNANVAEENEFVIPKAFCDKFFSPISNKDSESVQTATSKYDSSQFHSSTNSTVASVASKQTTSNKTTTSGASISLREYMAMKNKQFSEETPSQAQSQSPCSVMQSQFLSCDSSPNNAVEEAANDNHNNNMTMFSPQTQLHTVVTNLSEMESRAQRNKSFVSAREMKLLFQGFQEAKSSETLVSDVTKTPAPHNSQEHDHQRYLKSAETVSSLGHSQLTPSVFQFAAHQSSHIQHTVQKSSAKKMNHLLHTVSTKKSVKSMASDMKTISRLLDCGSSYATETDEDDRDISCHTLTTEFDLLHNYRAPTYETLRRRIIDVEQPLLSAKMVK